ncbi:MAG TPA: redoxin domain-containing protein [Candidatus Obscuribacterales bacterium]
MPLRMDAPMPSIEGGTDWFNSPPLKNEDFKGQPVLVHFWAISCGICKESLPEISSWLTKYGEKGLKILSVHMPRQESDTNVEAVKEAIDEYEVKQPCVVDNWHEITDGFENKYVPAFYLFDAEGKLRQYNAGEKAAKMIESKIERDLESFIQKKEGASANG